VTVGIEDFVIVGVGDLDPVESESDLLSNSNRMDLLLSSREKKNNRYK